MLTSSAKKTGRGGARKGAGRPPSGQPRKTEHTVTLDAATLATLQAIDSNLSKAIRIMTERNKTMHNCHHVGTLSEGSPVCHNHATKAILAVSDEQGKRLQAYVCDEHAETERAYFERIGHKQVTIEPIRN